MIDITGQNFGRLVAIKATEGRSKKVYYGYVSVIVGVLKEL